MTDLVLLPGLICDRALWAAQIAALEGRATIMVGDITRGASMAELADHVLAAAPKRFALAGLSMGGYVAFEIMRRAPGRVERLALLDTSARPDTEEAKQSRRTLIEQSKQGDFKGVTPKLLPKWVHPDRVNDPAIIKLVTDMTQRVGRDAFIRQQTAIMGRPDSRPGLSKITVPTLVLCGRQDQATPLEHHREIAADIPNARLTVLDHCGHLSAIEKPAEVSAALATWLGEGRAND